jgi:cytosine deaminase
MRSWRWPRHGDGTAARAGLASYGIAAEGPADFVVVDAGSVAEAVAMRPRRKLVIKGGRIVAKDGVLVP